MFPFSWVVRTVFRVLCPGYQPSEVRPLSQRVLQRHRTSRWCFVIRAECRHKVLKFNMFLSPTGFSTHINGRESSPTPVCVQLFVLFSLCFPASGTSESSWRRGQSPYKNTNSGGMHTSWEVTKKDDDLKHILLHPTFVYAFFLIDKTSLFQTQR